MTRMTDYGYDFGHTRYSLLITVGYFVSFLYRYGVGASFWVLFSCRTRYDQDIHVGARLIPMIKGVRA